MTEAMISDQPAGEPPTVAPYQRPELPTPTPAPAEAAPMASPVATGGSSEVRPNPTIRPDGWVENPRILGSTGNASFGGDISAAHGQLAHYTDPIGGEGDGAGGQDAPTLQPPTVLDDTRPSPSQP